MKISEDAIGKLKISSILISDIRIYNSSGRLVLKERGVLGKYTFSVDSFSSLDNSIAISNPIDTASPCLIEYLSSASIACAKV